MPEITVKNYYGIGRDKIITFANGDPTFEQYYPPVGFDIVYDPRPGIHTRKYTLDEIKEAFWKNFHKSGEVFFNTHNTEGYDSPNESTLSHFLDFVHDLTGLSSDITHELVEKYKK